MPAASYVPRRRRAVSGNSPAVKIDSKFEIDDPISKRPLVTPSGSNLHVAVGLLLISGITLTIRMVGPGKIVRIRVRNHGTGMASKGVRRPF